MDDGIEPDGPQMEPGTELEFVMDKTMDSLENVLTRLESVESKLVELDELGSYAVH